MRFKPLTLLLLLVVGVVLIGTVSFVAYAYSFLEYVISDQVRSEFESRLAIAANGHVEIGSITCDLHGSIKMLDVEVDPLPVTQKEPKVILKIREMVIPWNWSDVLLSNRLKVTQLKINQANLIVLARNPSGGDSDSALGPNYQPSGTIGADGSIQPPGSSFGFLFQPDLITITDSQVTLQDFKGKTWATLTGITAKTDQVEPSTLLTCVADQLTFAHTSLVLKNIHFPLSVDAKGGFEVKSWTAEAPFGPLSGTIQVQDRSPTVSIHSSGSSYDKFVGMLGFDGSGIDEKTVQPLSFDSQWTGIETGHISGSGQFKLSESSLTTIPAFLQIFSQLSPKIDPVSGSATFTAKMDVMGLEPNEATLSRVHVKLGLPDFAEMKMVRAADKHRAVPAPTVASPQVLTSDGTVQLDMSHSAASGEFSTPISPVIAEELNTMLRLKPPITDKWYVKLTSTGTLNTLVLTTVQPPVLIVTKHQDTATPSPTTPHHRRRH